MGVCCCSLGGSPAGRGHHNGDYCKVQLRFVAWPLRNLRRWQIEPFERVYGGGRISITQGRDVDASTMTPLPNYERTAYNYIYIHHIRALRQ